MTDKSKYKIVKKPPSVHIKQIHALVTPTAMGSLNIIISGLGDDDKVYQQDPDRNWIYEEAKDGKSGNHSRPHLGN